jgi:hypothetical protein
LATVHPGKTSHSMVLEKDSIFFVFAFKLIVEQFLDLLADLTINKHYLAPLLNNWQELICPVFVFSPFNYWNAFTPN